MVRRIEVLSEMKVGMWTDRETDWAQCKQSYTGHTSTRYRSERDMPQ